MSERVLIVNADDLGASEGINRGIIEAHERGVVTSSRLTVLGAAAEEAAQLAPSHPRLSVGLHWDLDGEGEPRVDFEDTDAVRAELRRQVELFHQLMPRPITHLDSHHHVHLEPGIAPIARELAVELGLPLRGDGRVTFIGGFYGQWEWGVSEPYHVSPEFLIWILHNELGKGWTELGCHPGYVSEGFTSVYRLEREIELATLTDARVREEIAALGIRLASYAEFDG